MKSLIKRLVSLAVARDCCWRVFDSTVLRFTRYAEWDRERLKPARQQSVVDAAIRAVIPDLRVRHGTFQGMKYPEPKSADHTIFPKLIGSYEREIQPILERICTNRYTEIVNIGCCEGYYAVGLAMRIPSAKVFAYDTAPEAIRLCKKMAALNGVDQRIVIAGFCDPDTLKCLPFSGRSLVLSDCEGYEKELFTNELVPFLAHHELLIEIHDLIDIEISSLIRRRFENTHAIETIQSIDDIKKAQSYWYEELSGYDTAHRRILLAEHRPAIMEWFYMTPRSALQRS
jgi:hypothetical protein